MGRELLSANSFGLKTAIPGPKSMEILKRREAAVPSSVFNTVPVFADSAQGALVSDIDGNVFIDFVGGIGVLNIGSTHPEVTEAIKEQVDRFLHTCFNVFMYESYVELAERLNELTPGSFGKQTMLVNSGAEAVENAIKVARKATNRPAVITFENAFHGRTLLTMSLTSKVNPYKSGFGPFAPEIYRAPTPYCYRCPCGATEDACNLECLQELKQMVHRDVGEDAVAAVIIEPVQGEGGFITVPQGYIKELQAYCREIGAVFVVDEIQTGFGRTGYMLASDGLEIEPDMITTAKSLAAGMPLSAVTGRRELFEALQVGGVGGTFSGNPVACVAALKVIEVMERDDYPAKARVIGDAIRHRLDRVGDDVMLIGDVRGMGGMMAVELVRDRTTKEPADTETSRVIKLAMDRGLALLKAGILNNVIRFLPPLNITDEQLSAGLDILEECLRQV